MPRFSNLNAKRKPGRDTAYLLGLVTGCLGTCVAALLAASLVVLFACLVAADLVMRALRSVVRAARKAHDQSRHRDIGNGAADNKYL